VRLGRVVRTTVGGYVAFLAVVLIFHVWLAKEPDAFVSALWGGAFLSGIAVSVAWCSSLLGRRSRRHS
jgi:cytochrome bd-type quinol oxidase subunit 1